MKFFQSSNIQFRVDRYFQSLGSLKGKTVIDIFAGKGESSRTIRDLGADVEAYDLFPEFFDVEGVECRKADIADGLPIEEAHADIALFQEGIEHLPDQLGALRELNRVLKPDGRLIVTTPNVSHLRAKFSNLLVENEIYNKMPVSELDAVWYLGESGKDIYYGHVFVIGIQKLRVLAKLAGFDISKVHTATVSRSSLLLGLFLYPLIVLVNLFAYSRSVRAAEFVSRKWKTTVYGEALRLNLNPKILFGKHLFIELRKSRELDAVSPDFFKKFNHTAQTDGAAPKAVYATPDAGKYKTKGPYTDASS